MTLLEFQSAFTPIGAKWPRGYSGDQIQLIFDELKTLSHADFVRLVRHILGTARIAPMIPDFQKAVRDLNIHPVLHVVPQNHQAQASTDENFLYQVRENVWADNTHIFIRGERPGFILKKDHPTNELVVLDSQVRSQKISIIKKHLTQNTYSKLMEQIDGFGESFRMEGL